ncbi:MotA/TolQ/ExbB proton channel [Sulfurimonas denitrificans DSM 1251]|uniref:MotA/TolQ/ExbB proton channel n=1 Tax=Sulfurimonas denitrificans (strain ATCC 33889 / DSM 1251) TaxID=326298 RepID=Q30RV1_SULDN|nr:TonB-system energizer ExbB [Sulfurimonas denitrificans]ABB44280.1 MotA/TolQ/ExbB proton channel [Sulfurimonas denitrificans DSM 1251]MDD3443114.1 TonB-system energizer ExbB [Sulfurimonas denitrificans]
MEYLKESVDYGILAILFFMSFVSIWLSIERYFFYKSVDLMEYKTKNEVEVILTNNLSTISSIASNAPYVGLLGTVMGIMVVFYDMGQNSSLETSVVVIGLSLALKATALGLLVAIPSMMLYSAFLRKTDILFAKWEDEINKKI